MTQEQIEVRVSYEILDEDSDGFGVKDRGFLSADSLNHKMSLHDESKDHEEIRDNATIFFDNEIELYKFMQKYGPYEHAGNGRDFYQVDLGSNLPVEKWTVHVQNISEEDLAGLFQLLEDNNILYR